jgi:hypothetical protein
VQGDDLSPQKVVSRRDVRGDLDIDLATAQVQIFDTPVIIISVISRWVLLPTVLEDLEPP